MQYTVVFNEKSEESYEGVQPELCEMAFCLSYSDTEITEAVTALQDNLSQNEDGWSWIFCGSNHGKLLGLLSRKFFAQQRMVFIPLDEMHAIADKLRLDNNVVFYIPDATYERVNLIELYSINNGPLIQKILGCWNHMDGLKITEEAMWERRSDLQGVELRNLLKRYCNELLFHLQVCMTLFSDGLPKGLPTLTTQLIMKVISLVPKVS